MHLRLRPSPTDPTQKRVFAVRASGEEVPDPASQERWDAEHLSQQADISSSSSHTATDSSQHPCFIQTLPNSVLFPDSPSNFVVEFMDTSCKFVFMIHGGSAQWYFKNTCTESYIASPGISKKPLPPGFEYHANPFFSSELVSLPRSTFKYLAALWEGRTNTGWICNDTTNHRHYMFKVVVGLADDGSISHFDDLKHTMHMVCGSTNFETLFAGLCGHRLNDSFSMTWIWDYQNANREAYMVMGPAYTYLMARLMHLRVENLGWGEGDHDGAVSRVWALPLPCAGGFLGRLENGAAGGVRRECADGAECTVS